MSGRQFVQSVLVALFIAMSATGSFATTYYMCVPSGAPSGWSVGSDSNGGTSKNDAWATFDKAFNGPSGMSGEDTLIMCDGTYTSSDMTMNASCHPPDGASTSSMTEIKAENDGGVIIDGGDSTRFYLGSGSDVDYVKFRGIEWVNTRTGASEATFMSTDDNNSYIHFYRCGFRGNDGGATIFNPSGGTHYLAEECYAYGAGRCGFRIQHSGTHAVYRRCVVRLDRVDASDNPVYGIATYSTEQLEVQNCIVIDSDSSYWDNFSYSGGAFHIRKTDGGWGNSRDIHFRGCIALNNLGWNRHPSYGDVHFAGSQFCSDSESQPNSLNDMVLWDVMHGIVPTTGTTTGATLENITIYAASNPDYPTEVGSYGTNLQAADWTLKNSIIIGGQQYGFARYMLSDYNVVYNVSGGDEYRSEATEGAHDYCADGVACLKQVNPENGSTGDGNGTTCLKYITRIEDNSDCDGTGESSADRGATVLKRYGVDGTFWGESGYTTLTDVDLWPFPYEDHIRTRLKAHDAVDGAPGDRGFCADGETLTKYIWEYLGNTIPSEIYGGQKLSGCTISGGTVTGVRVY